MRSELRDSAPVRIIHVLLSDFVRLGVHIDWVLRLRGHKLRPDDAALLSNLSFLHVKQEATYFNFSAHVINSLLKGGFKVDFQWYLNI